MPWETYEINDDDDLAIAGARCIGRLFRRRRHRLDIPQRRLEALTGVDQTVISRLETGRLKGIKHSKFLALIGAMGGLSDNDPIPPWISQGRLRFVSLVPGDDTTPPSFLDAADDLPLGGWHPRESAGAQHNRNQDHVHAADGHREGD